MPAQVQHAYSSASASVSMDPHVQRHQEYYAANGGYAYYAPPQYNYNAHAYATGPPVYQQPLPVSTSASTTERGAGALVMPPPQIIESATTTDATDAATSTAFSAAGSISVHDNDVLMGRGGKNNQHTGNERLRDMARAVRDRYKASAKKGKSNMSRELVQQVRDLQPPGRFLKRNPVTNEWEDVGDDIAREKVSQVLRDAVSEWTGPKAAAAASKQHEEGDEEVGDAEPTTSSSKKRAKPSTMLPPLPPPPPEIATSKSGPDKTYTQAAVTTKSESPPAVSSNAAVDNGVVKLAEKMEDTSSLPTTVVADTVGIASSEILNLQDDLDDLPLASDANLLMSGDAFLVATSDESLTDNMGMVMGRDRVLSDVSFNDTTMGGEFTEERKLEVPDIDYDEPSYGAIQPMRSRLDTNDSLLDDSTGSSSKDACSSSSATEASSSPTATRNINSSKRRPSLKVPVTNVPWNRNKRKTNLLDRYANMNMGLSSSDMSICSIGSQQLSSRNLGTQLSSHQLMSTGARQMSRRQLSSRQLSSRQLSSRQLSSRQLSGHRLMSMDQRKQNFAMMGESDLSLDTLSISGDTNRSLSRKNVFMEQYMNMDMGLSDFSLGSMAAEPMHADESEPNGTRPQRPSIIIEGDLEELSEHGSRHLHKLSKPGGNNDGAHAGSHDGGLQKTFSDTYNAVGMGTSISNMTVNTIGTLSGHSRRGFFASTGNSMRIESGHSFMTMGDLQLEMLDDELFDEFGTDAVEEEEEEEEDEFGTMEGEYGDNEFVTEFC